MMNFRLVLLTCVAATRAFEGSAGAADRPGFRRSAFFGEQVRDEWLDDGVRVHTNLPTDYDPKRPTQIVVYATPNGNTIEQTLGCAKAPGLDWHCDIQHVAAQVRQFREWRPDVNVVLAVVEADGLSWPGWRRNHADAASRIARIVGTIRERTPGLVTLTGHSGGGSFITGLIESADVIPNWVERIAYLDANYSYSDGSKHGDKLLAWLHGGDRRRLHILAYDDRNIMLDGKRVVGPDGGTFRATQRMLARFRADTDIGEAKVGDFINYTGLGGRLSLRVHVNPQNKILHTALVGEMNGLMMVLTDGDVRAQFGGPRAYGQYVQPAPGIPPRPAGAPGGAAFFATIGKLDRAAREEAIAAEIIRGNIPEFLRAFRPVALRFKEHGAILDAMPDYLAIGSNDDFVRVPMSPLTAQRIADAFGCTLPTRRIVDEIHKQSALTLAPIPLTEAREAVATFAHHNALIERQRAGRELGLLVAGIKKDVVVTNRLGEKANRVALYGWHQPDGSPIQPLTIVHVDWYVDYSHGVRLIRRSMTVDGKPRDLRAIMHSADLCGLVSDEGPIGHATY